MASLCVRPIFLRTASALRLTVGSTRARTVCVFAMLANVAPLGYERNVGRQQPVGWVEQSETHRTRGTGTIGRESSCCRKMMGFALNPSYGPCGLTCDGSDRFTSPLPASPPARCRC